MTADQRTQKIKKLEFFMSAAGQPLPIEQLRKEMQCSLEEFHEIFVQIEKPMGLKLVFIRGDLAAVEKVVASEPRRDAHEE